MPVCASESLTGMWPSNESLNASGSISSGFHSPGSPVSLSPISTSPDNTLKRRMIRRASSIGTIIQQEPFVVQSDLRDSRSQSPVSFNHEPEDIEDPSPWVELLGWYPCFLMNILRAFVVAILPKTWKQLVFAIPMFWISMWVWCFWQLFQLPLTALKFVLSVVFLTPKAEKSRRRRTVLISGGSTIQALHLARNFYSAGARVIVCEVDGQFALARFSTAVSKFYTVPRPNSDQQQNYVRALCDIVNKESAVYYISVSATTPAYFDAVAKPHLELLGCTCFSPGIREVRALDDILEVFKRCQKNNLPTPLHYTVTSRDDVMALYESGIIRCGTGRFTMSMAGASGIRERLKIVLPPLKNDVKVPQDISEQKPWVVVQDVEGDHFLTCTTIKDSKVIANVSCKLDRENNGLVPVEHREINQWIQTFCSKLNLLRPITGHVSFHLAVCRETALVKPLSARVGVSLPYICYTDVHPRLLWKPCKHFSRQNSGPLVAENGRYWMPETVMDTIKHPSMESMTKLVGTVLDKREALFTIWDPLPYCAYYHMQLPFRNFIGFIRRTQNAFPTPMAVN